MSVCLIDERALIDNDLFYINSKGQSKDREHWPKNGLFPFFFSKSYVAARVDVNHIKYEITYLVHSQAMNSAARI